MAGGSNSWRGRIRTKAARFRCDGSECNLRLGVVKVKSTHRRGRNGGNICADHGLIAAGGSRRLIVRVAIASCGIASIVCAMLMLHHAIVISIRMRTTHCAIGYLRFGDLRRQGEGEDRSDNARDADSVTDHVSKLQ